LSMTTEFIGGPTPRFCSLVFGQDSFNPNVEASTGYTLVIDYPKKCVQSHATSLFLGTNWQYLGPRYCQLCMGNGAR